MKKTLLFLFFIAVSYKATDHITYSPDPIFEQALINLDIDSDGIVNGQVLTSDVEDITELYIEGSSMTDITGIQDFTSLEKLSITFSYITELDVSQNLQLKELDCSSNYLTSLNVSSNTLLEVLHIGNTGGDMGPWNEIEEIDLSNNPNIHTLYAYDIWNFKRINLKNGNNNPDMILDISFYPWYGAGEDPDYDPTEILRTICIEVDNSINDFPYSEWDIMKYHTAYILTDDMVACSLSSESFVQNNIKIYPNPVTETLYFDLKSNISVEKVIIFDNLGRKVFEQNNVSDNILVSDLQKGNYILKIFSDKGVQTEKIIVK